MSPTIPQSVSVTGYGTAQEEATQHNAYVDENSTDDQTSIVQQSSNKRRSYITLAILLAINLLNYADRFTIAGAFLFILVRRNSIFRYADRHSKILWRN